MGVKWEAEADVATGRDLRPLKPTIQTCSQLCTMPPINDANASTETLSGSSSATPAFTIRPARTPDELRATAALLRGYAAWLDLDLSFQAFEDELASLPGKYTPESGGEILLAYLASPGEESAGEPVGCIALRDITAVVGAFEASLPSVQKRTDGIRIGEFKRLYVLPAGRSLGIGKALIEQIIRIAEEHGYSELLLDTLPIMQGAQRLYRNLGFRETGRYYNTHLDGTIFMSYSVDNGGQGAGR